MFRTTIKSLVARKLRLLTTSVAVMLGVAFMAGTLVLTDTLDQTLDATVGGPMPAATCTSGATCSSTMP
jgi:putative ABC transport system permease protein